MGLFVCCSGCFCGDDCLLFLLFFNLCGDDLRDYDVRFEYCLWFGVVKLLVDINGNSVVDFIVVFFCWVILFEDWVEIYF